MQTNYISVILSRFQSTEATCVRNSSKAYPLTTEKQEVYNGDTIWEETASAYRYPTGKFVSTAYEGFLNVSSEYGFWYSTRWAYNGGSNLNMYASSKSGLQPHNNLAYTTFGQLTEQPFRIQIMADYCFPKGDI